MTAVSPPRLAIIGGGQLGMFLCEASARLGIETVIVAADEREPAVSFADQAIIADYSSAGLAARIAAVADVVTFEFEAVPAVLLDGLLEQQQQGTLKVRPKVEILALLKDKGSQKQWLADNHFPTLPFTVTEQPLADAPELVRQFGLPFVQKAATGGYDGYGVQIIRSEADLDKLWDIPSMIEACVDEPLELGVVLARAASGETAPYAPVRMTFKEENVLDAVVSPTGMGATLDNLAVALATEVVERLGGIGVFAVELFVLPDKSLIINEISPRVHNSGHHTIDACEVSQFEQHVRAVCDMPLGNSGSKPPAAVMRNLLYSDALEFLLKNPPGPVESAHTGVFLHWYGKSEPRKGRKMGHITCLCSDPDEADQLMNGVIDQLRQTATGAAA